MLPAVLVPQRGCSGIRRVAVLAGVLQCDRGLWLEVRGRDRAGRSHRVKFGRAMGQELQAVKQQV